jgi:DNA-binding NarL/FixJ family response regulator
MSDRAYPGAAVRRAGGFAACTPTQCASIESWPVRERRTPRATVWISGDDCEWLEAVPLTLGDPEFDMSGRYPSAVLPDALLRAKRRPDVLLFLPPPGLGPADPLGRVVRAQAPRTRVLLVTRHPGSEWIAAIARDGLAGYLSPDCTHHTCARAIRGVLGGETWVPRRALVDALRDLARERAPCATSSASTAETNCTRREQEILDLVRAGLTNKEIARRLGVVEDTVKKHLQHVYDKFGVRRRTLLLASRSAPAR